MGLVDRYLARNIAVPLIGTLILAAMLLVLEKMLRLFDFVITAGGLDLSVGSMSALIAGLTIMR